MGAYPLVAGQRKAAELAKALKAKVVVPMNNGDIDLSRSRIPLDVRLASGVLRVLLSLSPSAQSRPSVSLPLTHTTHTHNPPHTHYTHTLSLQRMIKKGGTMGEFQQILREVYPSALVKETPAGEAVTI